MNSIFHINVFSQIALTPSSPIEWQEGIVTMPTEEWKLGTSRIRTAVATGLLALSLSTGAQERPTALASNETQPILLAQANVEDGRTWPYPVMIPQVSGWTKMVEYYKNKRGLIIPPPIENGKLADGSNAPADPLEAKAEQRSIIAKYDKNAQLMLAAVSKEDILWKANNTLKEILNISEQGKLITKEQLLDWFYSAYIFNIWFWNWKADKAISWLESIAKIKMKMNESEITQIKRDAELKAKNIWKSVTGAVA